MYPNTNLYVSYISHFRRINDENNDEYLLLLLLKAMLFVEIGELVGIFQ